MSIQDRIIDLIKALGKNQRTFAQSLGVASSVISHIVTGNKSNEGKRNAPSHALLEKIGNVYSNVNMAWLVLGEGTMFKDLPAPEDMEIVKPNDATLKALLTQLEGYREREAFFLKQTSELSATVAHLVKL